MPASHKRVALLGDSYPLSDGFRARLRMARISDAVPIRALLDGVQFAAGELDVARLVHFDPRRRCVICATGLIDGAETMVGIGSVALDGDGIAEPDTLVVAEGHAEDVAELLAGALTERAVRAAEARAA